MDLVKQGLIAQIADREHDDYARPDPIHLLDMGARELGMSGGAANLHHAKATNNQHKEKQPPVKIAK